MEGFREPRRQAQDSEPQNATQVAKSECDRQRRVRTLRSEVLDHVIVINDRHLHAVLAEFAQYYNRDRPHRSLDLQPPLPTLRSGPGPVASRPVLGGLHHVYARAT